jgi:hypothetical protein
MSVEFTVGIHPSTVRALDAEIAITEFTLGAICSSGAAIFGVCAFR